MSKIVRVVIKNVIEFEYPDDSPLSNYDKANLLASAKKAMLTVPSSIIANDAKYKIKEK